MFKGARSRLRCGGCYFDDRGQHKCKNWLKRVLTWLGCYSADGQCCQLDDTFDGFADGDVDEGGG